MVFVRVELQSQLLVRLLQVVICTVFCDTQDLVVIFAPTDSVRTRQLYNQIITLSLNDQSFLLHTCNETLHINTVRTIRALSISDICQYWAVLVLQYFYWLRCPIPIPIRQQLALSTGQLSQGLWCDRCQQMMAARVGRGKVQAVQWTAHMIDNS